MKHLSLSLRPLVAAAVCALLAACSNTPPQQDGMDYRSAAPAATPNAEGASDPSGQRLIIKSGEGERLNLPWFIRDTQDWINRQ